MIFASLVGTIIFFLDNVIIIEENRFISTTTTVRTTTIYQQHWQMHIYICPPHIMSFGTSERYQSLSQQLD